MNTTTILTEPSQLSVLSVRTRRGRLPVTLVDARVDRSILVEWAARLNESYLACGCGPAAIGLGLGACFCCAWLLARAPIGLRQALLGVAMMAALTCVGKAFGLARANRRLRIAVEDVRRAWYRASSDVAQQVDGGP